MTFLLKMIDRLLAVLGALVFMQAPQYIQDYVHVLYGHLSELNWQLDQIRTMTAKSGKTVAELAIKFLKSNDHDIVFQGELIDKLLKREEAFTSALRALREASPFSKPFLFLRHHDLEIAKETWRDFKFALPLTLEAMVWGLLGLFMGYLLFRALYSLLTLSSGFALQGKGRV